MLDKMDEFIQKRCCNKQNPGGPTATTDAGKCLQHLHRQEGPEQVALPVNMKMAQLAG